MRLSGQDGWLGLCDEFIPHKAIKLEARALDWLHRHFDAIVQAITLS